MGGGLWGCVAVGSVPLGFRFFAHCLTILVVRWSQQSSAQAGVRTDFRDWDSGRQHGREAWDWELGFELGAREYR